MIKRYIFISFCCIFYMSCITKKYLEAETIPIPPNTVYLNNGLYIDKNEVSNINYREYLFYLEHRYSENTLYKKALPDTLVWAYYDTCFSTMVFDYFRMQQYDEYPVVGTSYEQAVNYTKWRSDRVMEMFLATKNIIQPVIIRHGFREIIIFNCHGGNLRIAQVAMENLGYRHPEVRFTLVTWWKLAAPQLATVQESGPGGVGHACEFETSLLQYFAPEQVRTALIPHEITNVPTFPWAEGDMLRGGVAAVYRRMDQMTPNGVFGAPFLASPEKGRAISGLVVSAMAQLVHDLRAAQ